MSVRLLKKSEVDQKKASDRKREMDEGLKLARRVDSLREVMAQEEAALKTYRASTLSVIQDEINEKNKTLIPLRAEVADLETRRALALAPLDAERERLQKQALELSSRETQVIDQEKTLHELQSNLEKMQKDILKRDSESTYLREQTQALYNTGAILNSDADRKLREADNVLRVSVNTASATIANAEQRETWVQAREEAVLKKEDELRKRELEIDQAWTLLRDRQALLERNIKQHVS